MNQPSPKKRGAITALRRFGFKSDVFSTLPLRREQLDLFVGHEKEIARLRDGVYSMENCALVGEPGSGKSSLVEQLRAEIGRDFEVVSIAVPVADGAYFLKELLQQLLVTLNRKLLKKANFRALGMELRRGGDDLSKSKLKTMVLPLLSGYAKPLVVTVDDLEKIKADVNLHLNRTDATLVLLEEMKDILELGNVCFVFSLQKEFYGHVERMMASSGETTLLGLIKNIIPLDALSRKECYEVIKRRVLVDKSWKDPREAFADSAIAFAISRSEGNPRKLLFFLSEALYAAHCRGAKKVGFDDLFGPLNKFYRLDHVQKKVLFYLSEHPSASYDDEGLVASLPIDRKSVARRLAALLAKGFLEARFACDAVKKVYFLKGSGKQAEIQGESESRDKKRGPSKGPTRYEIG